MRRGRSPPPPPATALLSHIGDASDLMGLLTSHHAPKSQPGGTAAQHLQSAPRAERGLCLLPQLSRYVLAAVRAAREALLSSLPSWREREQPDSKTTLVRAVPSPGSGAEARGLQESTALPTSRGAPPPSWSCGKCWRTSLCLTAVARQYLPAKAAPEHGPHSHPMDSTDP